MQRYFAKKINNDKVILEDSDYHHIKNVMKMKTDDNIEVVFESRLYLCNLEIKDNISVKIIKELQNNAEKNIEINLIVPVLKETKMDIILQKSTELGVNKITPIITERSIVKIDQNNSCKKLLRWQKICKEASEQSKRVDVPKIEKVSKLKDLKKLDGLNLICSTTESNNSIRIALQKNKNCDKINIVIGPEGGLTQSEEDYLEGIGFEKVTLGSRILRVETVPLFLLSVIDYEFME